MYINLWETCVYNVYNFLDKNNVLFEQQFDLRKRVSASQTLLNISQKIMDALDNGKYGCGVFIDLQKAFDMVGHAILLNKLYLSHISLGISNLYLF